MASAAVDVKSANLEIMVAEYGYDVTIVCTSDGAQAAYWESRLNDAKGTVIPAEGTALAVDEDWPGGAGNFLGTLYAWQKACQKLEEQCGRDLAAELAAGTISVALFHTAGKGTRMAPLPGGENNNKPGVKLPAPGGPSILECVIRQTGVYASSRKGRLSVFWGDQIFVPSVEATYTPRHHVDIACMLGPMPSAEEWDARGLEKYGCIAATQDGTVEAMLEKVPHEIAAERVQACNAVEQIGASLGSFSLSAAFLAALLAGFEPELTAKEGKMDSDPHVWMPLTLSSDAYADVMVKKGELSGEEALAHWQRVAAIVNDFQGTEAAGPLFGAVDVGLDCSWWDYGLLKLYVRNMLLLTEQSQEAMLARKFFGIPESDEEGLNRVASDCALAACSVDGSSVVSNTTAKSGSIVGSAVFGCAVGEMCVEDAIAVNCCAKKLQLASGAVCYNVVDDSEEGISLGENEVRVGVWMPGREPPYFEMSSNWQEIDGGKKFKEEVMENGKSFQDVYIMNQGVDVIECSMKSAEERARFCTALDAMGA